MINKIKEFVIHNSNSFIFGACALLVLGLGINYELKTQRYETKIEVLELANSALNGQITDTAATNENLTALVKFYKDQVISKGKRVRDIKSYISDNYKTIAPEIVDLIAQQIVVSGEEHGVPVTAIVAVMEVESHFKQTARSEKYARGLMQVMYSVWGKELGIKNSEDLYGIEVGIDAGVQVLKRYLNKNNNNMEKALNNYLGGSGSKVYNSMVYKSMAKFVIHSTTIDIMEKEAKAAQDKPVVVTQEDSTEVD